MALSDVPSRICLDLGSGQLGDWAGGEKDGRRCRGEIGREGWLVQKRNEPLV